MIPSLIATLWRRIFGGPAALLRPGTPAPDFAVADHTGVVRRLADYRGRRVVLWFYPKASTPG